MLRPAIAEARARLQQGMEDIARRHREGAAGSSVAASIAQLRCEVLIPLFREACTEAGAAEQGDNVRGFALVAHGGTGRGDVAPFSDVDLMLLYDPRWEERAAELARSLVRDVFDAGLTLGHSVRTVEQACRLAAEDPQIATSLLESRLWYGDAALFGRFEHRFGQMIRRERSRLLESAARSRREECLRFGETVYLLEPNVKRSRGGLRDLQWTRWIGAIRFGHADWNDLERCGAMSADDCRAAGEAYDFLLRLRNELHFAANSAADVLTRAEQCRIASQWGFEDLPGLLGVEQFMQTYFRHTEAVADLAQRLADRAASRPTWGGVVATLLGHRIDPGVRVGPGGLRVDRRAARRLSSDWDALIRLAELSAIYQVPWPPETTEVVRAAAAALPPDPSPEARRRFLHLLEYPGRLGEVLRRLHRAGVLDRFVPGMARARGLLQFNQYHKYTVDEHCLRAVENAEALLDDRGPLGRVYRSLETKRLLHLALLMHDLGKGRAEDHRIVGAELSRQAASEFALSDDEASLLEFLVRKHQMLTHEAFHRDSEDEETVVRVAVQTGSPERLELLYVMTACDLGAVGPGVWDGWKCEVVTRLFHRTMQCLAAESPATTQTEFFAQRRAQIAEALGEKAQDPWFARQIAALPESYLQATEADQAADDLRLLFERQSRPAAASAVYRPEIGLVEATVATSETVASGVFHKLTGALTGLGLEILAAEIHTFADAQILDRFRVRDPDFQGEPPPHRMADICHGLVSVLADPQPAPPRFRRLWQPGGVAGRLPAAPPRVSIDNATSTRFTIIDVLAADRPGLLYDVARCIYEHGLSVWRARIATYHAQVVDVFYVTDREGRKRRDATELEALRRRLLEVIVGERSSTTGADRGPSPNAPATSGLSDD